MNRDDLLDVDDVLQHPGRVLAVDISADMEHQSDVELLAPVEGGLEAVSTGNLLLITGTFGATVRLECARCSAPLESSVAFEIEEQFQVEGVPAMYGGQDPARVVDEGEFPLFEANALRVEELLREELIVALPVQPLCEHGWDGPCPRARSEAPPAKPAGTGPFAELARRLSPPGPPDGGVR